MVGGRAGGISPGSGWKTCQNAGGILREVQAFWAVSVLILSVTESIEHYRLITCRRGDGRGLNMTPSKPPTVGERKYLDFTDVRNLVESHASL